MWKGANTVDTEIYLFIKFQTQWLFFNMLGKKRPVIPLKSYILTSILDLGKVRLGNAFI